MSSFQEMTSQFYDAVWDFSTQVYLLPDQLQGVNYDDNDPPAIIKKFKASANPFLDLDSSQIPNHLKPAYLRIDAIVRQEIIPAFEVIEEEYDRLSTDIENLDKDSLLAFAEKTAYLVNEIEMYVIAQTSGLMLDLSLQ